MPLLYPCDNHGKFLAILGLHNLTKLKSQTHYLVKGGQVSADFGRSCHSPRYERKDVCHCLLGTLKEISLYTHKVCLLECLADSLLPVVGVMALRQNCRRLHIILNLVALRWTLLLFNCSLLWSSCYNSLLQTTALNQLSQWSSFTRWKCPWGLHVDQSNITSEMFSNFSTHSLAILSRNLRVKRLNKTPVMKMLYMHRGRCRLGCVLCIASIHRLNYPLYFVVLLFASHVSVEWIYY